MLKPPVAERTRLFNPWALLVVTGAVGGLLWFTLQDEKVFAPGNREPDQVSINYAQLLLAAHPEDAPLRLRLVEQLLQLGDYPAARGVIGQWPQADANVQGFYLARIDALSLPPGADPAPRLARLDALDMTRLSPAQLQALARVQLQLGAPASAARTYAQLAASDAWQRPRWLLSQAQWAIAAADPQQAAAVYGLLLDEAGNDRLLRRTYLQQAFTQNLAADQGPRAVDLLLSHLAAIDDNALTLLADGVDTAIAHQLDDSAQRLLEHWRTLQPDNPQLQLKAFELRLAAHDLPGAWVDGQALAAAHPDNLPLLRRVAAVGEWVDARAEALALWLALLAQERGEAAEQSRAHAWRLALALGQFGQAIELLEPLGQARPFDQAELDALLFAYGRDHREAAAEAYLRDYLSQHPEHRAAWMGLLHNLERRQSNSAQAQVWAQLEQRFGLAPSERVAWAETHLRDNDPASAWKALQADTRAIDDRRFWRSRANVAWALDDREHVREALEHLLALDGQLPAGDRSLLVDHYRTADPARALQLAVQGWTQAPSADSLGLALQLAHDQADWPVLRTLLASAGQQGQLPPQLLRVQAHAALASHEGDFDAAARAYQEGLRQFPDSVALREQLLWLYLDRHDLVELAPLVAQWRTLALTEPSLWLPMASAQSALGDSRAALAWYRLAARQQPANWMAQAAYADALETAGYEESAWRWRRALLRANPLPDTQCNACLQTWLRLLASSVSVERAERLAWQWRDGSPALLQLWFERWLARLDAADAGSMRDEWLAWARQRGLRVDSNESLQQALRGNAQAQLQGLLSRRDLPAGQRADVLARLGQPGAAWQANLAGWAAAASEPTVAPLRQQAAQLAAAHPQGVQSSWKRQDFGGLRIAGPSVRVASLLGERGYADAQLSEGRYQGDQLIASALGSERNLLLNLERGVDDGAWKLVLDASLRDDHDRTGLGIARSGSLAPGQQLEAGLDWHRQSDETGLMRTFGQRDQLYAAGRHRLGSRDELSWRLSQKRFSTREGDRLGSGQALNLMLSHVLEAAAPEWVLRTGLDYQRNRLGNRPLAGLASNEGGALDLDTFSTVIPGIVTPRDLLQERYGQLFVGSGWRRGNPGALNRTSAQYSWLIDTNAGWQWEDQTFNYGIAAGIGVGIFGGDELALKVGYQSAPQGAGGKPGGVLNLSYSVRLGR